VKPLAAQGAVLLSLYGDNAAVVLCAKARGGLAKEGSQVNPRFRRARHRRLRRQLGLRLSPTKEAAEEAAPAAVMGDMFALFFA
jgi:hypothetical protein